jgi:hypothetical protein
MVAEFTVILGCETVTVTVAVPLLPLQVVPSVPVTVYVVVTAGDAVTVDPPVVFNPVEGDHV